MRVPKSSARLGGWAAGIGISACALACAAPLVLAATGSAVVASIAAAGVFAKLEIAGLAIAAGGLALVALGAIKRRRTAPATACGCARGTAEPTSDAPVACTLDAAGGKARAAEFRAVFERAYLRGERLDDGVRWRFRRSEGLLEELTELANREHACCRFFEFDVTPHHDEIWWETRTSAEAQPVLDEFFALPRTLAQSSIEQRVATMTATFRGAGGHFGPGESA